MPDLDTLFLRYCEASQLAEARPHQDSLTFARQAALYVMLETPEDSRLHKAAAKLHRELAGVSEVVPLRQKALQRIIGCPTGPDNGSVA